MRRLSTSRAGAGLIEYALLVAVLVLGLAGVMTVYRNSVGSVTRKTAITVSKQAGRGYRREPVGIPRGPVAAAPSAGDPSAGDPEPADPGLDPDSLSIAARSSR